MTPRSNHLVRGILPVVLTLCIVLAGFSLLIFYQNDFLSFKQEMDREAENVRAKRDIGAVISGDLEKIETAFYSFLYSAEKNNKNSLLAEIQPFIDEIHDALNLLSDGGTLTRKIALNLPDRDTALFETSYHPREMQQYNLEVLILRPQLVTLEEKIHQIVDTICIRNDPLHEGSMILSGAPDLHLKVSAKEIRAQFDRMHENANKLAYDTNVELQRFEKKIAAAEESSLQTKALWVVTTIIGVVFLISLIARQILRLQNNQEKMILDLQHTEKKLQASHSEILLLNESLEDQIAVRTHELKVSERLWSDAFDSVTLPIFLHNQKGRIIKANNAYLALAECSFEAAFGCFYWDIFPKREGPLPGCLDLSQGKNIGCSFQEQDVVVDDKIFRSQSFPIYDGEGTYLYSMHHMEDVTEKSVIRQELRASDKRFREVTNSLRDVLILIDKDLKVQLLNDAAKKAYGVTDPHYSGKYCYEVFWNKHERCEVCPTLDVMRTGETISAKRYLDSGVILNRINSPVHDADGNTIGCAVIAADVTEQEKQLQELKRFEQIISTSKDLVAFYDHNHILLASNRVYADYFNVDYDTIVGRHASEIVGAERYKYYLNFYDRLFEKKESISFKIWADYHTMGKRHMDTSLVPYIEEDGTVSGVVSRTKDITDQTEQEAKLRLSAKVFESTIEGITITDKGGTILAVNKAFCTITGYSEAEVLGENPRLLKSGRHDKIFYAEMWKSLAEKGTWRGEIWNKNKAGRIYPELLTISSILDEDGKTMNYVAVFSDITSLQQATEQLEYQAHHHPLTGLPNRLMLHIRLEHSIQHAKREGEKGAILFLDLDNFKKINDSLGHNAGDEVLKEVALRLRLHSREVDTVSHLSGDEFVVILQKINSIHDAATRAQEIIDSLQKPFQIGGYELYISASIGITEFSGESSDIEELLKNADAAMYKAKNGGKNCYQLYSSDITDAAIKKVVLETQLRHALERNELVLYYQPQVTLPEGEIVAVEALVRWQHADLGLVPPDDFIPLSEETGLIVPMGEWILRTACEQIVTWQKNGYSLRRIAVNLSGKQIQQNNLVEVVERILLETGCPPSMLELEITEGFVMNHPEQSITVLQQIRALGVEFSIDDFGTGHSSLNYLKRLPINRLKIDRSFVWDINENPDGEAIIKAVIAMGHSLNLQITAEGIETQEQQKFLEDYDCDEGQGYLFSKPLPVAELEKWLHG